MKFYYVSDEEIARIERVMNRLYSEQSMNADDMRDNAHLLLGVVEDIKKLPAD